MNTTSHFGNAAVWWWRSFFLSIKAVLFCDILSECLCYKLAVARLTKRLASSTNPQYNQSVCPAIIIVSQTLCLPSASDPVLYHRDSKCEVWSDRRDSSVT